MEGANVAGLVAAALFDLDLHFKATARKMGDDVVGVDDRNVVRQFKVRGGDDTVAFLAQRERDVVTAFKLEHHALEVEQDVHNVFEHTVDLRVFVNDTRDLRFGGRITDHGAQQDAAQSIPERVTVAAFERFERDDRAVRVGRIDIDFHRGGLQKSSISHVVIPIAIPSARYTDKAVRVISVFDGAGPKNRTSGL